MAVVTYTPPRLTLEDEGLELLSAFILIKDPATRRNVITMTQALICRHRTRQSGQGILISSYRDLEGFDRNNPID